MALFQNESEIGLLTRPRTLWFEDERYVLYVVFTAHSRNVINTWSPVCLKLYSRIVVWIFTIEMRNEFLQDFEMDNIKSCQASQSIWQLITQQWKELKIVSNAI